MMRMDVLFVLIILLFYSIDGTEFQNCVTQPTACLSTLPLDLTTTLKNQHLVMIGDSLTRYQYVSLVYALRHRQLIHPLMQPNMVQEKDWSSWNDFYKSSNNILKPYEVCDCFRPPGISSDVLWFENRYYHDPELNITVTFISYIGSPKEMSHGHIMPLDVNDTEITSKYPVDYHTEDKWKFESVDLLLSEHVANFLVKPTAIILNTGRWGVSLVEADISKIIFSAFDIVEVFIWKTTTFDELEINGHSRAAFDHTDSVFSSFDVVKIMDTSWTKNIDKSFRWDAMHFKEPVYSVLNLQLVEILKEKFSIPSE